MLDKLMSIFAAYLEVLFALTPHPPLFAFTFLSPCLHSVFFKFFSVSCLRTPMSCYSASSVSLLLKFSMFYLGFIHPPLLCITIRFFMCILFYPISRTSSSHPTLVSLALVCLLIPPSEPAFPQPSSYFAMTHSRFLEAP